MLYCAKLHLNKTLPNSLLFVAVQGFRNIRGKNRATGCNSQTLFVVFPNCLDRFKMKVADQKRKSRDDSIIGKSNVKLPGAASLYEQLDKLVLVCLRDGRNFFGWLRSFDQFANLILDNAVERLAIEDMYADVKMGIFVIRGENVMLLGEVDEQKELEIGSTLKQVSEEEIRKLIASKKEEQSLVGLQDEWPIPEEF